MGCDSLVIDIFWSLVGLISGIGIGSSLGFRTGKRKSQT